MREAYRAGEGADQSLVVREGVRVDEDDGKGAVFLAMETFQIGSDGIQVGPLDHPDCFPREAPHNLPGTLCVAYAVPALPAVSSLDSRPGTIVVAIVKLDRMFLAERIGCVPHQRHAFVNFKDGGVERGRSADIEVEYLGPGLVPDEQEVFESFGDEESMFVAFALEESVGCDGCREADVV